MGTDRSTTRRQDRMVNLRGMWYCECFKLIKEWRSVLVYSLDSSTLNASPN